MTGSLNPLDYGGDDGESLVTIKLELCIDFHFLKAKVTWLIKERVDWKGRGQPDQLTSVRCPKICINCKRLLQRTKNSFSLYYT